MILYNLGTASGIPTPQLHNKHNPYGYLYNVNHPQIRPLYERYKLRHGIPDCDGPSETQRREFERYMMGLEQGGYFKNDGKNPEPEKEYKKGIPERQL